MREPVVVTSLELKPEVMEVRNNHLQEKYQLIRDNEVRYETKFMDDADYMIVAFGSAARKQQLEKNDKIFKDRWGDLVKQEKDFTKHRNPIDALRRQIQPKYFKKGLFYSKSVLPDKTVWRILGVKITKKHTGGGQ